MRKMSNDIDGEIFAASCVLLQPPCSEIILKRNMTLECSQLSPGLVGGKRYADLKFALIVSF